jgi:large subunit ribosomal protein L13
MKTQSLKPAQVKRVWYVLDASEASLGRLATTAATLLLGKEKPQFTPHVDNGDFVIVLNAQNLRLSGNKLQKKTYYRHSGFPGGLRSRTASEQMEIDPQVVIKKAIRGMLPVNKLRPGRLERLKIYNEAEHNHAAQNPTKLSLKKEDK